MAGVNKMAQSEKKKYNTSEWPILLKNYDRLNIRTGSYRPLLYGYSPLKRPLKEYIRYGIINLDKPANSSTDDVISSIKRILRVEKIGHSGKLDPEVTGNLIVLIDRATRLLKSQQRANKEYICVANLHSSGPDVAKVEIVLQNLTGDLFLKPLSRSAVKGQLRVRTIFDNELIEYNAERNLVVFRVSCEEGTDIGSICVYLGRILGVNGHMQDLKRVRSGILGENDNMVNMNDVRSAQRVYEITRDESNLRRVIMPVEMILTSYKRLVVKDLAIISICYGNKLLIHGLLRFENDIDVGMEVVVMTTKGEAIAIGIAEMTTSVMATCVQGVVAKIKRVVMEINTYNPTNWKDSDRNLKHKENNPAEWCRNMDDIVVAAMAAAPEKETGEGSREVRKRKNPAELCRDMDDIVVAAMAAAPEKETGEGSSEVLKRKVDDTPGSSAAPALTKKAKTKEAEGVAEVEEKEKKMKKRRR